MNRTLASSLMCILLAAPAGAWEKDCTVNDAQALIERKMKTEAMACLDQIIEDTPKNERARYAKGMLCMENGDYACAHNNFGFVRKPKSMVKIAEMFKSAADAKLKEGNDKQAVELYTLVGKYDAKTGSGIADGFFARARDARSDHEMRRYFQIALGINPELSKAIGEYYVKKSGSVDNDERRLSLLALAAEIDDGSHGNSYRLAKESIGRAHLDAAAKLLGMPGKESQVEEHVRIATSCLGAATVDDALNKAFADAFFEASNRAASESARIELLAKAAAKDAPKYAALSQEARRKAGMDHLDQAKLLITRIGSEAATEEHRRLAVLYLGAAAVDAALPDTFMLRPLDEPYVFRLKKGEKTPYWIKPESAFLRIKFFSTNNQYEVRYRNGVTVGIWKGDELPKNPSGEMTLVAIEDTEIVIEVRK